MPCQNEGFPIVYPIGTAREDARPPFCMWSRFSNLEGERPREPVRQGIQLLHLEGDCDRGTATDEVGRQPIEALNLAPDRLDRFVKRGVA